MSQESLGQPFPSRLSRWLWTILITSSVLACTYYAEKSEALPPIPALTEAGPDSNKTQDSSLHLEVALRAKTLEEESSPAQQEKRTPGGSQIKKRLSHGEDKEDLYHLIIARAAKRHRVDPALVKAIIMAESGYNARAISKKGASGLMQLMPKTARALGVKDAFDPEHNVDGGVRYFRQLLNQFDNDVKLAVAAYNAGSRKVREHRDVPPIRATQIYVKKVFEYYKYYKKKMSGKMDNV